MRRRRTWVEVRVGRIESSLPCIVRLPKLTPTQRANIEATIGVEKWEAIYRSPWGGCVVLEGPPGRLWEKLRFVSGALPPLRPPGEGQVKIILLHNENDGGDECADLGVRAR